MSDEPRSPFAYAILRVVPRVERGERFNAGVVLFCRQRGFLGARVGLDDHRLAALSTGSDLDELRTRSAELRERLNALARVAVGDPEGGPLAVLPPSERFGWLVAPASTTIQPSEVHTGLCADPAETLEALFSRLVGEEPGPAVG